MPRISKTHKYKVEVLYIGIPHFLATCYKCGWNFGDYRDRRAGQKAIRDHVASTGHTVSLEKMVSVHYGPKEQDT